VLIGDMSFVGPRPDVPGYADKLEGEDRRMLLLKPGITGPASLKYRNEEELLAKQENPQEYNDKVLFPDKVRLNIEYLDNWSFSNDIKFIIYTVLGKDL
jgi:lipopolysaccharide/colanic/teichoic acid biosynthesis glycosyltransferase